MVTICTTFCRSLLKDIDIRLKRKTWHYVWQQGIRIRIHPSAAELAGRAFLLLTVRSAQQRLLNLHITIYNNKKGRPDNP